MPDELWTDVHDIVQETGIKTILMEKKNTKKENGCLRSIQAVAYVSASLLFSAE